MPLKTDGKKHLIELDKGLARLEKRSQAKLLFFYEKFIRNGKRFVIKTSDGQQYLLPNQYSTSFESFLKSYFYKIFKYSVKQSKKEFMSFVETPTEMKLLIDAKSDESEILLLVMAGVLARKQIQDFENLVRSVSAQARTGTKAQKKALFDKKSNAYINLRLTATLETEANRIVNDVRTELLRVTGLVDSVVFTAVMDDRTSVICSSLNGTIVPLNSPQMADIRPPLHTHCRSYLVGTKNGR